MYYSPEGADDGVNDDDSDLELRPPRIKLERLRDMLGQCPDLEVRHLHSFLLLY